MPSSGIFKILTSNIINRSVITAVLLSVSAGLGAFVALTLSGAISIFARKLVSAETPFTKGQNIASALEVVGALVIMAYGIIMLFWLLWS
jgi:hypothetical protein